MSGVFAPVFGRHEGAGARWCVRWWDHGEAVLRLEALWRSWEALRLDPVLGMSRWLRDYLDPQLAILTSATGPFQSCNTHGEEGEHYPPEPLRLVAAPKGYWEGGNL